MKILNAIWKFIKYIFSKEKLPITLMVICLILVASLFKTCSDLHNEKAERETDKILHENNLKAMQDSITIHYNKELDRMVAEKTSYVVKTIDDLKLYNKELYNEMKSIKNSVAGIKSDVGIIMPTLTSINGKIGVDPKDSTKFVIPFDFEYNDAGLSQKLIGNTQLRILDGKPQVPTYSTLTTNFMNVKLTYTLSEKDDKYMVSASSPSKLVQFTELNGALILDKTPPSNKKCTRWGLSAVAGTGINTDILFKDPRFGWFGGLAVTYDLIKK